MIVLLVIVIIAACLAAAYLIALRPNTGRQGLMAHFAERYIAHRGLFDNKGGIPENSLAAFKRAADAGYGIELDVQLTTDARLVVFHDESTGRMCSVPGSEKRRSGKVLHKLPFEEVSAMRLLGTEEKIPLLSEVLDLVAGRVPLIIEIKPEGRPIKTVELTMELLKRYSGTYCIESFHPGVLVWLRENSPETIRGQLSMVYGKGTSRRPLHMRFLLSNLLFNRKARPDFIAYDHRRKGQLSFQLCRKLYRPVCVAWTIKNQEELESARRSFDIFIFDSFIPADPEQENAADPERIKTDCTA